MTLALQTTYSTAPAIGFEGMLEGTYPAMIVTAKNAEASASIGFGRAVVRKAVPTSDLDAVLPSAETDKPFGIVVHSHNYTRTWIDADGNTLGDLDTTGLKPGVLLSLLRKGRILVKCEDGCVPGDKLWIRAVAAGDPEFLGGLNSADDSTDMIDATAMGEWQSTATAGGLAWLEVDFTNK